MRNMLFFMLFYCFVLPTLHCLQATEWLTARLHFDDGTILFAALENRTLQSAYPASQIVELKKVAEIKFGRRPSPERMAQVAQAIEALSSLDFEQRKAARETLLALKQDALPQLQMARRHKDPEVSLMTKRLLSEIGGSDDRMAGDIVSSKPESEQHLILSHDSSFLARTRFGLFEFPIYLLRNIVFEIRPDLEFPEIPGQTSHPLRLEPPPLTAEQAVQIFNPFAVLRGQQHILADRRHALLQTLGAGGQIFDFDTTPKDMPELNLETALENYYAAQGLLLSASEENVKLEADHNLPSISRRQYLTLSSARASLSIRFCMPGLNAISGGVNIFGFMHGETAPESLALEAYDRDERLLIRAINTSQEEIGMPHAILALHSPLPIARIRILKLRDFEQPLRIDDLFCSGILPVDRNPYLSLLTLQSGERLGGMLKPTRFEGIKNIVFEPAFMNGTTIELPLEKVVEIQPPGIVEAVASKQGPTHAILMQTGERLYGTFEELDALWATIVLPGAVTLKLPRTLLRKVDLFPQAKDRENEDELAVKADEKIGVEFRQKQLLTDAASPMPDKDPETSTPGLPRMDNAEIVSMQFKKNMLSVDPKDGAGVWPIGLSGVRFLVFPENTEAALTTANERRWLIEFKLGGKLRITPESITNEKLKIKIADGSAEIPTGSILRLKRVYDE